MEFTATLTRSDRDAKFAFYKSPSKGSFLEARDIGVSRHDIDGNDLAALYPTPSA